MRKRQIIARRTALFGILCAEALALNYLEGIIPTFLPLPGAKIGLSNIVTMYCVSSLGISYAFAVTLFKAIFALLTRGFTAFLLSLSGGLLSLAAMILFLRYKKNLLGFIGIGVVSALMHNIGQLLACSLIMDKSVFSLAPALLILSILTGILTGTVLKYTFGYLQKQCAHLNITKNLNREEHR